MVCLTKEHIYMIQDELIKDFGGTAGVYDFTDSKIESILAQQYPYFGHDKYPTIFDKAAALMYFFIKGHCFRDGNKRLGVDVAIVFLTINGYEDHLPEDEIYEIAMMVAASQARGEEVDQLIIYISRWLEKYFR